jgi:hypothetical protein
VQDVEEIVQLVKKLTLEAGSCQPTVFVNGSQQKVAIGMKNFGETSDARARDMLNAGTFTAYKHSVGELESLVFVSEAWMSEVNEKGELVQPSRDPKRIETLIINCLDVATQDETVRMFEMVRNPKGELTDLNQMSLPEGGRVKGMLLPAFLKGYQLVRPVTN